MGQRRQMSTPPTLLLRQWHTLHLQACVYSVTHVHGVTHFCVYVASDNVIINGNTTVHPYTLLFTTANCQGQHFDENKDYICNFTRMLVCSCIATVNKDPYK